MRSPADVIASAIRYDHLPGTGAQRILEALHAEGYEIVPADQPPLLPETNRMFREPADATTVPESDLAQAA